MQFVLKVSVWFLNIRGISASSTWDGSSEGAVQIDVIWFTRGSPKTIQGLTWRSNKKLKKLVSGSNIFVFTFFIWLSTVE